MESMPKKIKKYLQYYFSKIKNQNPNIKSTKILSRCRHTKTASFVIDARDKNYCLEEEDKKNGAAATLDDIDQFLLENFRSLYIKNDDHVEEKNEKEYHRHHVQKTFQNPSGSTSGHSYCNHNHRDVLFESSRFFDLSRRDLCGSRRFFVFSGSSGSHIEEGPHLTSSLTISSISTNKTLDDPRNICSRNNFSANNYENDVSLSDGCIAVLTYSPCPYDDFQRSMLELVEARQGRVDWDFMEDLLLYYLDVNEKKSHKYILSAFVDIVSDLRQSSDEHAPRSGCKRSQEDKLVGES